MGKGKSIKGIKNLPTNQSTRLATLTGYFRRSQRVSTLKRIIFVIKFMGALIGILLLIGLAIGSSKTIPNNAKVYVNDQEKTYLAPSCTTTSPSFRGMTAGEARKLGYEPDKKCRDGGAFVQDDRSLTGMFLQTIGVLKPMPSRWNEDGSWNY
jgi:hypothetical protein